MNIIGKSKKLTIIAFSPHTDDAELGCGGTLSKLVMNGHTVIYVYFTYAGDPTCEVVTDNEIEKSMRKLKIKKVISNNIPIRHFQEHRQKILDSMMEYKKEFNPDIIMIPSLNDIHQDHKTVAEEAVRAYKDKTILCYEMPWNNLSFNNQLFVEIEKINLYDKITAISEYKTQSHRLFTESKYIESIPISRGLQIKKKYAEVFEVVRQIW